MTATQLIKRLQALNKKYPRCQVLVDLESRNKNMDGDWAQRCVESAMDEFVEMTDDDGHLLGQERRVISLKVN